MNSRNYLSAIFIALVSFSSIYSATNSNPVTRLKNRLMERVMEEIDKKTTKKCTQMGIAAATLIIIGQLLKPKENERKSTPL